MRYRAEIDGLRAVAILPVVLFHAGISAFSGGFAGVDVFFVISGYLITTIIRDELAAGELNLTRFYERRARRILPALFVVMAFSTAVAWNTLALNDIQAFAKSLIAVPVFLSNVLFWTQSGYFDTAVDLKPLLHTWSLSVEEQYYIIFPLVMLGLWRRGKKTVITSLIAAALFSLAIAQWGVVYKPNAAFYLLPARAWEILLGSVAALTSAWFARKVGHTLQNILSLVGLMLIATAIFGFKKSTPFPGVAALVPTAGAVLILLFGTGATWVGKLLSQKALVFTGMISYSFYLWHQPVFAFVKYHFQPNNAVMLLLVVLSFLLGVASWRYVERPFRRDGVVGVRAFTSACVVTGLAYIAIGVWGVSPKGYAQFWYARQSADVQRTYDIVNAPSQPNSEDDGNCRFNASALDEAVQQRLFDCHARYGAGYVVLGDSHAIDLFSVVTTSDTKHPFIFGLTSPGCRPHTPAPECSYDSLLSLVSKQPQMFAAVIYEQAGFYLLRSDTRKGSRKLLSRVPQDQPVTGLYPDMEPIQADLAYLRQLSAHVKVLWFGPRVEPHINKALMISGTCRAAFRLRDNQYATFQALDMSIAAEAAKAGVPYLSQIRAFRFDFANDLLSCDGLYWDDGDHFSAAGERRFGQRFDIIHYVNQLPGSAQ